ncbi:MAG TPA: UbiX family flavin prenyltransferase [Candidatus Eremiobacteraceae bacterium]|nr:UbiX family flavin prenyltransferase [Candidatus Eremiobacteraceae bacterium]
MPVFVVGISGASGVIYGVRTLQILRQVPDVVTHLVISAGAKRTLELETAYSVDQVCALANVVHEASDLAAPISSGSFRTDGMIVAPCSVKTASAIAYSLDDNLLVRAADVTLKERRRLVLMVRETPLHLGHLRTLTRLAEIGAAIVPPIPGFYSQPKSVDDVIDHSVGKALDVLGVPNEVFRRWRGPT